MATEKLWVYQDRWVNSNTKFATISEIPYGACVKLNNGSEIFKVLVLEVQDDDIIGLVKDIIRQPRPYNIGDLVQFKRANIIAININDSSMKQKQEYRHRLVIKSIQDYTCKLRNMGCTDEQIHHMLTMQYYVYKNIKTFTIHEYATIVKPQFTT
jgi:hypothetical protein